MQKQNQENSSTKRNYQAPSLSFFGSLSGLTQTGSGKKQEGVTKTGTCDPSPMAKSCL